MVSELLVASIACVVPAMAAMWWFVSRYEGYFDDRRMFVTLAIGLFAGVIVAFLENQVFRFNDDGLVERAGVLFPLTYFVVGYAAVESLAKIAVLASKRYRNRKDTPYYGVALGLGFGAILGMQNLAIDLRFTGVLSGGLAQAVLPVLALVALHTGAILAHGATAVLAARGAVGQGIWKWVAIAAVVQMPIQVLRFPYFGMTHIFVPGAVAALLYGLLVAYLVQAKVLAKIVPPEILDQLRKARRRELRRQHNE